MTEIYFIINGINYTKDEILTDDKLKKEYLEILKYNKHKEKVKNTMKNLRKEDPEKYKEAARIFMKNKYNNDLEYRIKVLEKARERRHNKAILENKPIRTGRGRPQKYTLNDNLECIKLT